MSKGKHFAAFVMMMLLLFAPLVGEHLATRRGARAFLSAVGDFRECTLSSTCVADFDGDGIYGTVELVSLERVFYPNNRALLVIENSQELLWLPFYHGPQEPPTRFGVRTEGGRSLLLVYRGSGSLARAVLELEDKRLEWAVFSKTDLDIFNLMDAYDTTRMSNKIATFRREELSDFSVLKLTLYYLTLCGIAAITLYRKSVRMSAAVSLNSSGGIP